MDPVDFHYMLKAVKTFFKRSSFEDKKVIWFWNDVKVSNDDRLHSNRSHD